MITEIYHVSSRCGGGKSLHTIQELHRHLSQVPQETVVFASKTNDLTQQNHEGFQVVSNQSKAQFIESIRIDSSTEQGSVIQEFSEHLASGYRGVIFISHESLSRVRPDLLKGVRLIVDEVPQELAHAITVRYEDKDHGSKWEAFLKEAPSPHAGYQKTVLDPSVSEEEVQRYIDNIREGRDTSTTQVVALLLEFLLEDYEVMYTTTSSSDGRIYRLYQAIHWQKLNQIIKNVDHFAILSAQLKKTLLGFIAEHHCGITIKEATITPNINLETKHKNWARIFPILEKEGWSSTLKKRPANEILSHAGTPVTSTDTVAVYAQQIAADILKGRKSILTLNKNDPLHPCMDTDNIARTTNAVHGQNNLRHFDHAIYLASSRPDPFEVKSLQMFAVDHNLDVDGIVGAVRTERCYESAYQCVARTSIRSPQANSEKEHILIVPDMGYAKYIQSWFEPGYAVIDTQHLHTKQPTAKRDNEKDKRRKIVIQILADQQNKRGKLKDLIAQAGISPSSFKRYKEEFRPELEVLGLIHPKRYSTKTDIKTAA
ncbi:hypothetical protein [Litchfieldella anticariensis]|nr:hypothetical protein [Halomonas anticariensis]